MHLHLLCAGLEALVEAERAERMADARAQVAYDAELAQLRLSKLQAYYTASLAVHHLTLHALRSGSSVSTIRQAELPKELLVSSGSSLADNAVMHECKYVVRAKCGKAAASLNRVCCSNCFA
jgi:hypothetical protein